MTDTDPRLEAALNAINPTHYNGSREHRARDFLLMHDALRAFDQGEPHTVTSVTGYPIEDTSWLSQGVELNSEMLASIAISLKKLVDYCGKPQPESEVMPHSVEECDALERGGAPKPKRSTLSGNLAHPGGCYHCENGAWDCFCPGVHGTAKTNNATARVMEVDPSPSWLEFTAKFASEYAVEFWEAVNMIRGVLAFANAQPPSEAEIDAVMNYWIERGIGVTSTEAAAALIAAAKARSGD